MVAAGSEQEVRLLLTYFPGNGEAITASTIDWPAEATLLAARSQLGTVSRQSNRLSISYERAPIGVSRTDTLTLKLQTGDTGRLGWQGRLATTVDTESQRQYRAIGALSVVAPVGADWGLTPAHWYAGESLRVEVVLRSRDPRRIDAMEIAWPGGVRAATEHRFDDGNTEPADGVLRWPVDVTVPLRAPGGEVGASLQADGLTGSPLPPLSVAFRPAPRLAASSDQPIVAGKPAEILCTWTHDGEQGYETDLVLSVTGSRSVASSTTGVHVEPAGDRTRITLPGVSLQPGEAVSVTLRLIPQHAGPLALRGSYRPADREAAIDDPRVVVLSVVDEGKPTAARAGVRTDLEQARAGIRSAWDAALADLPVPDHASIRLRGEGRHDANWLVEEAATAALLARGGHLPLSESPEAHQLSFRVASSRSIYEPTGKSWNPFDSKQLRDTRVVVHARLTDPSGHLLWARRVASAQQDHVAGGASALLGGADGVTQTLVPANQRALEAGLSGLIVGSLFFVFFAP